MQAFQASIENSVNPSEDTSFQKKKIHTFEHNTIALKLVLTFEHLNKFTFILNLFFQKTNCLYNCYVLLL